MASPLIYSGVSSAPNQPKAIRWTNGRQPHNEWMVNQLSRSPGVTARAFQDDLHDFMLLLLALHDCGYPLLQMLSLRTLRIAIYCLHCLFMRHMTRLTYSCYQYRYHS